jgi:hypothetical protein
MIGYRVFFAMLRALCCWPPAWYRLFHGAALGETAGKQKSGLPSAYFLPNFL